jgi:hypothetical protein
MNRLEVLKAQATRQFRHNDDNSPDVFNPEGGFVFAYDRDVIDKGLAELQAKLAAVEAQLDVKTKLSQDYFEQCDVLANIIDRARVDPND